MLFESIYRRFTPLTSGKGPLDVRTTFCESVAVAQVEPPAFEMSRAGRRFRIGNNAAITGIAPVQALPTTTAQWVIFNASSTKSYAFEELGMYLTSGTPGVGGVLLAALFQTPSQIAVASGAGVGVSSSSSGGLTSAAICKATVTITVPAAPNWYPVASNASPNVGAFPGSATLENRSLAGGLIVPPLWGLALNVVGLAGTTPLFAPFATWVEIETDLE